MFLWNSKLASALQQTEADGRKHRAHEVETSDVHLSITLFA